MAGKYPSLETQMSAVLEEVVQGKMNPLTSQLNYKRTVLHHRLSLPASNTPAQFKFFQSEPANPWVGNWSPNGLGADQFAILYNLRFKIESGLSLAGAAVSSSGQIVAAATEVALAEFLRLQYENGLVNFSVGERVVLDNVYGLENFPAGAGPEVSAAFATTATTTSHGAAVVNNGSPFNKFEFTPPIVVLPQKRLKLQVDNLAAIAPPVDLIIRASCDALIVNPLNN